MAKWYKFKHYYLLRHIATGGMAEIFLAKQIGLEGFEKLLVIKKILKQYAQNPDFISMFLDEAKLAAKLDHPNIIRIYDFGKEKQSYYIAMEYIAGEDLRTILRKISREGSLIPIQHALQIVSSICEGLDHAHKKKDAFGKSLNIIHRDISPQNIMISYEGNVKILDFGIAKATTQSQETEAGVLKGKYAYMSPEQAKGKKLDHRSDIFAVGILLYEMLTSKRLFKAENQLDTLRKLVYEEIPSPKLVNPDIPDNLVKILMKALSKDVDERYQTAREFQNDIEEFLAKEQIIASTNRTSKYMQEIFKDEIQKLQVLELRINEEQKDIVNLEIADIAQESGLYQPGDDSFVMGNFSEQINTNSIGSGSGSFSGIGSGSFQGTGSGTFQGTGTGGSYHSGTGMIPIQPKSNKKMFIIIAFLLLLLGAGGAFIATSMNKPKEKIKVKVETGTIQIKTDPVGATIILNGKTYKDKTPTIINHLALNESISLKIIKQGYMDEVRSVVLDTKKLREEFFKLKKSVAKVAIINISSKPVGATIYLDNKKLRQKTPTTLEEIAVGEHSILIEVKGYDSYFKKFSLEKDEFKKINVELFKVGTVKDAFISLDKIKGATVTIDGKKVDLPLKNYKVKPGQDFEIVVKKPGYETYKITKNLKIAQSETIEITLKKRKKVKTKSKTGTITINTISGSTIFLDGKKLGTTTGTKKVRSGTHKVRIVNSGKMINYTTSVSVKANTTTTKTINIGKGKVAVSVQPWANVYINGRKIGQTPFPPKLLYAGRYTIKLENPKFKSIIKTITIKEGDTKLIMEKFK